MSQWFFQRHKIQSNLLLALITHNPVQIIINLYIISFTCIKYILHPFTYITFGDVDIVFSVAYMGNQSEDKSTA